MKILDRSVGAFAWICLVAISCGAAETVQTDSSTPPRLTPPLPPARPQLVARPIPTNTVNAQGLTPVARFGPASLPVAQNPALSAQALKPLPLVWDSEVKDYQVNPGETNAGFTFNLTNTTSEAITITQVHTSCGCTVAKLPATPWTIEPGTNGQIQVSVDLRGKRGLVVKTITVYSTAYAAKQLTVKLNIPEPLAGPMGDRARNLQIAAADRQAVFRNDCISCHAAPAAGRQGAELYVAVCGVCHEAEHRASMVPDLRNLNHSTDRIYWKVWAAQGKVGTLMPGFSKALGGPLDDDQIESLADYLASHIPSRPTAALATPGAK